MVLLREREVDRNLGEREGEGKWRERREVYPDMAGRGETYFGGKSKKNLSICIEQEKSIIH